MSRMKTFFKYFLAIVIVYIISDIASIYLLKSTYITKEYSVENSILDVQVEEAKATFVNGNIKGKVKNNTDVNVSNKYLKIDSYSERGVLLGTKYVKIKDLSPKEETEFASSFNYEQIDNMKISLIDAEELPPEGELDFGFDNPEDAKMTFAVILGAVIVMFPCSFGKYIFPIFFCYISTVWIISIQNKVCIIVPLINQFFI